VRGIGEQRQRAECESGDELDREEACVRAERDQQ
jgi:hypothetical protein